MPSLTELLLPAEVNRVLSGEVQSRVAVNKYNVSIGGRLILCRSGIGESISNGTRVVISKADEGYYIVGTEKQRTRAIQEVLIDG